MSWTTAASWSGWTARPATETWLPPSLWGGCEEAGLNVEYHRESVEGIDQCNVLARPHSTAPPEEVLFQTHLDTSEGGHFSQWDKTQANPFNASIYGDEIYGLGTADVKLDFLCKLEAIKSLKGRVLKTPYVLAGTFGAHTGMAGAIKLIRRKKLNAKLAFIGEPTEFRLVTAGQGLAIVEISVPFSQEERAYRRDHDLLESSSTQSRMFSGAGENAIGKMLAYLSQLPDGIAVMDLNGGMNQKSIPSNAMLEIDAGASFKDPILPKISKIYSGLLELEKILQQFTAEGFNPPYPTMNLGMVRTFEDEIRFSGCCRLPPSVTDEVYEGWMQRLGEAVQAVGATFRVKDYRKGFLSDSRTDFVRKTQSVLEEMGLNAAPDKTSTVTEASVFSRLGIECVVWGPGKSVGNSHAPNENIKISELEKAVEVYKRLLERFCI